MNSSGRSNTRKERLKQRLKLLEEQHLLRMAQYDDESRQLRQEYVRSLEQIELHFKAKMGAKVAKKTSGENVGEMMPVEQISLSDGTPHEIILSSPAQFDRAGPDSRCQNIQILQPNILSHSEIATEYNNESPHTISSPEFPGEIDNNFRSKQQSSVQLQVFCTANVRSSFASIIQNDQSSEVDGVHRSSASNGSRSMGQTEIVDTTNTNDVQLDEHSENEVLSEENVVDSYGSLAIFDQVVCITNTPTVTQTESMPKHSFSQIEPTQHYCMQAYCTSYNRFAKIEPKQNIAILTSASANSKKVAVEIGSRMKIDENSFIRLHAIDRLFAVLASYNDDCHPQSRTNGMEFDPGGFNSGCQRGLLLVERQMSGNSMRYSPRLMNIVAQVVGNNIPSSWTAKNRGHGHRSPSQNRDMTPSAYTVHDTCEGKDANMYCIR